MTYPIPGGVLTNMEAAMAMAMATMAVEPDTHVYGFSSGIVDLRAMGVSPNRRLEDNLKLVRRLPFDSTDCALPMIAAQRMKLPVDAFVVYTDNETWFGRVHPSVALKEYRQTMGIQARQVVSAFTASINTIADPKDPLTMDTIGLDASLPTVIANFMAGRI
jgi:60 kDa SS-A/Ro ribonucleoprotein